MIKRLELTGTNIMLYNEDNFIEEVVPKKVWDKILIKYYNGEIK